MIITNMTITVMAFFKLLWRRWLWWLMIKIIMMNTTTNKSFKLTLLTIIKATLNFFLLDIDKNFEWSIFSIWHILPCLAYIGVLACWGRLVPLLHIEIPSVDSNSCLIMAIIIIVVHQYNHRHQHHHHRLIVVITIPINYRRDLWQPWLFGGASMQHYKPSARSHCHVVQVIIMIKTRMIMTIIFITSKTLWPVAPVMWFCLGLEMVLFQQRLTMKMVMMMRQCWQWWWWWWRWGQCCGGRGVVFFTLRDSND